ncbi:S1 RNA-binding domain-containing protein, partial [Arthrobacter sp.]|uniref:S1 RNA-binding domain-containing protein n=1 Tax=Arthrobacter sp. TaxID=1667 RepID=UPI002584817C
AFVDIGVHQDGLVHVSAMSNTFVSDPHTVVKSGQVVRVKVLDVEPERKRISLTLRLDDGANAAGAKAGSKAGSKTGSKTNAPADDAGSRTPARNSPRGGAQGARQARPVRPGRPVDGSGQTRSPSTGQARPAAPAADTAMAEALRRAGLGKRG